MKLFFDFFIDTREKRYHVCMLITMIICMCILIPYIILSIYLISLKSYDSLFRLLKEPILEYTYVSRIILDAISIASYQFDKVVNLLISNIRWYEIVCMICIVLCFPSIERKKTTTAILLLFIVEAITIMALVYIGTHAKSLSNALTAIHGVGYVVGIVNLFVCILFLIHLIKHVKAYYQALQYEAIEIKEHTAIDS